MSDALEEINQILCIDGVVTHAGNEIKCWTSDGSGGRDKTYLNATDCARLATAFSVMAAELAPPATSEDKSNG